LTIYCQRMCCFRIQLSKSTCNVKHPRRVC
jgi:hypothetical protein